MCVPFLFDGPDDGPPPYGCVVSYVSNTFSFMLCVDKIYDKAFYQERKFGTTIRRVAFISSNLTV